MRGRRHRRRYAALEAIYRDNDRLRLAQWAMDTSAGPTWTLQKRRAETGASTHSKPSPTFTAPRVNGPPSRTAPRSRQPRRGRVSRSWPDFTVRWIRWRVETQYRGLGFVLGESKIISRQDCSRQRNLSVTSWVQSSGFLGFHPRIRESTTTRLDGEREEPQPGRVSRSL